MIVLRFNTIMITVARPAVQYMDGWPDNRPWWMGLAVV